MKTKIIFLLLSITFVLNALSQPGSLDQNFGSQGKVLEDSFIGSPKVILVQEDGNILVGGYSDRGDELDLGGFLLSRFKKDGSLDEQFGDEGKVILTNVYNGAQANTLQLLAIQPDGKILACGRFISAAQHSIIGIVRFNSNGSIDNSFGNDGITLTSVGKENIIGDMCLQKDGKILITGEKKDNENDNATSFILRYTAEGNRDTNFGNDGLVLTTFSVPIDIHAIGVQSDGKIIIGGEYSPAYLYLILVRYFPDGRIDSTFDGNGIAALTTAPGRMYDLVIQEDGKIVVAGTSASSMLVARFINSGSVDSTFGRNKTGFTILPMATGYSLAKNVFLQDDKSIILTGSYVPGPGTGLGAAKFTQSGIIDSLFGENGVAVAGFGLDMLPYEMPGAIQPDGKIIIGCSVWPEYDEDYTRIGMVRFNGVSDKTPKYVRIKKWLHHHGFTWEDWPGKNISYFAVQRSSNGNAFNEVARLFNRNNQPYSYEDAAPLNGSNYYRLAAVSTNGSTAYSNIIAIDNNAIKLYPNPVRNTLHVEGLSATEKTKLTITDFMGNTKMSVQVTAKNYNWNVSQLKQGNYILKAETKGVAVTKKFVKE